jgi:LmbE family N-acetylglucosaminyl deacetylase
MITSQISEDEWTDALKTLPVWNPPDSPILVVAPHPDDETLGAGGLIKAQRLRGFQVLIAAVTDGEKAYSNAPGLARVRRLEQADALARLGVTTENIIRFGFPDSDVSSRERELVQRLAALVSPNTQLIAPWKGDFHSDHEACGRAAEQVAQLTGAKLASYFFWTWHFGTVPLLDGTPLRRLPLVPECLGAKIAALRDGVPSAVGS